ncbi:MAG: sulfotransferase [Pseudomonadota bacterium]
MFFQPANSRLGPELERDKKTPNFLIIGAEKAGTTWLHDVLRAHPDLFLPDVKEVHFFNKYDSNGCVTDNFESRGTGWYFAHFAAARQGQLVGEATPMYLCDPEAPQRVADTLPNARFIVVLRDPVSRAWSHFRMARAKSHVVVEMDDLIAAQDPRFLGRGLYAAQLARWFRQFPPERFLLLFFEEVMREPCSALIRVADWLGVDAAPLLTGTPEKVRNAATAYRSARFYNYSVRGARLLRQARATRGLAAYLKASGLYEVLKRANRKPHDTLEFTAAQQQALTRFYREDRAALANMIGTSHLPWSGIGGRHETN